jgi:hypothetical protein
MDVPDLAGQSVPPQSQRKSDANACVQTLAIGSSASSSVLLSACNVLSPVQDHPLRAGDDTYGHVTRVAKGMFDRLGIFLVVYSFTYSLAMDRILFPNMTVIFIPKTPCAGTRALVKWIYRR